VNTETPAPSGARAPGTARAPAPYRRGWRAPWRGRWGPLSDGNSRLARRALKIERELLALPEFQAPTPRQRRLLRRAAVLEALAEQTAATLGDDAKSTKRSLTALEKTAAAKLAEARACAVGPGRSRHGDTLAARLLAMPPLEDRE
jgi:hypothetical protein